MNILRRLFLVISITWPLFFPLDAEAFFLSERPFDEPASTTLMLQGPRQLWESGDIASLERMSAQGDQASCYALATLTMMGLGTPRSKMEALEDLERLSRLGLVEATFLLAQTYASNEFVERDYPRALAYYHSAAEAGYLPAIESEGALLLFGAVDTGTQDQKARGERMLWDAAGRGSTGAMYNLSLHLSSSGSTAADKARARDLMKAAALGGHPRAQVRWATQLIEAEGDEPKSLRELLTMFEIAVKQNSKVARDSLWALLSELPARYGQIRHRLFELLDTACRSGRGTACTYLGTKLLFGGLANFGPRSGLEYLQMGYEQGDRDGSYELGMVFLQGKLAPRDATLASAHFAEASRRGNLRAMYNLALMNLRGDGVEKDTEHGCLLLSRAAELGYKSASAAHARQCTAITRK